MNLLHMKYAIEVAKTGSLGKASEVLLIAPPNISRSIKELEADIGISIFERTAKGMELTHEGEEFISLAKGILLQIEQMERYYKDGTMKKNKFSISVPRASYISEAFAEFSKTLNSDSCELLYKETNSRRTIINVVEDNYKLGIIRYAENYDEYFKAMLLEKGLSFETVTEFSYVLLMGADNPLAEKEDITSDDLKDFIEIAHADPYVPSMPFAKVASAELTNNIDRRIFVFERASQFDLLSLNPETFMWASPLPQKLLERYNLVQKRCPYNKKIYKDILIYKNGYKLTELDRQFVDKLSISKSKYL